MPEMACTYTQLSSRPLGPLLLRFVIAHFDVIGALLHNAGHQQRQCAEAAYSMLNTCVSSCLANSGKVRTTAANPKRILH